MLMVKPALAYLDVIKTVRESSDLPLCAYNVSAISMVKAPRSSAGSTNSGGDGNADGDQARRSRHDHYVWAKDVAKWIR